MSAADLLADFSHRGIQLRAERERLIYDAPQGVMKAADLEQLRKHKSELLAYLNREAANASADPNAPSPDCGSGQWWQLPGQAWHCRICEPDMPLTATTLTLPCHKERVASIGGLRRIKRHA
jgi:hypothetical protein